MSIGLLTAGSTSMAAPATRPPGGSPAAAEALGEPMLALLAVGICVLAAWGVLRMIRPEKFYLRNVPRRKSHLHPLHVVGLFIAYSLCLALAVQAAAWARGVELVRGAMPPMTVLLPAQAFAQVVMLAGALVLARTTVRHGIRRGVGLDGRHWLFDAGRGVVGFFAVLPLCLAVLLTTRWLIRTGLAPIPVREHPVLTYVRAAGPWTTALIWVSTVVLAPLAEELFFRGLVQTALRRYWRPWPAVLVASAVFAAVHAPQYQDLPALFVLAVALGYNYERSGRLIGPIVLHALFNGAMLWIKLAG